jgi:hypothetical protein
VHPPQTVVTPVSFASSSCVVIPRAMQARTVSSGTCRQWQTIVSASRGVSIVAAPQLGRRTTSPPPGAACASSGDQSFQISRSPSASPVEILRAMIQQSGSGRAYHS